MEELLSEVRSIRQALQVFFEKEEENPPSRFSSFTPRSSPITPRRSEVETEGPFDVFENVYMSGMVLVPPQNRFRASLAKIERFSFDMFINLSKSNFSAAVAEHFPRATYHAFYHEEWDYESMFEVVELMKKNRIKKVLVTSFCANESAARVCLCYLIHIGKTPGEALEIFGSVEARGRRDDAEEIVAWMKNEMREKPPPAKRSRGRPRKIK